MNVTEGTEVYYPLKGWHGKVQEEDYYGLKIHFKEINALMHIDKSVFDKHMEVV